MESFRKSVVFKRLSDSMSKVKKLVDTGLSKTVSAVETITAKYDFQEVQPAIIEPSTSIDAEDLQILLAEAYRRGHEEGRRLRELKKRKQLEQEKAKEAANEFDDQLGSVCTFAAVSTASNKKSSSSTKSSFVTESDSSQEDSIGFSTGPEYAFEASSSSEINLPSEFSDSPNEFLSSEISLQPETSVSSKMSSSSSVETLNTSLSSDSGFIFSSRINNSGVNRRHSDFALDTG